MKTTQTTIEASAPANVRPSSVSNNNQANREPTGSRPLPRLDYKLRHRNRQLPTVRLLHLLQDEAPEFRRIAHVVGQWVWIQFRQKQPQEVTSTLSQFGFHWNHRRKLWQHPCGTFCTQRADYDPRRRYGSHVLPVA